MRRTARRLAMTPSSSVGGAMVGGMKLTNVPAPPENLVAALNDGLAGLGHRAQDIRTQNNIAVVRKKHTPIDYVAILPLGIEASNTNRKMGIR